MAANEALLLSDRELAGSETLATSYRLSCGIRTLKDFDIILCGRETLDGSTGQVGPETAYHLGIPYITYVSKIIDISSGQIHCVRLMEDHYEELKAELPVLITVIKEINQPRIPSLKGMLKAKKAEVGFCRCCDVDGEKCNFGQEGSPTRVVDVWTEQLQKEGKKVEGEPEELASALYKELEDLGVV